MPGSALKELQGLIKALTYGEMIELAEGMRQCRPQLKDTDPASRLTGMTLEELPAILHRWATTQLQQGEPIAEPPHQAAVAAHNPC
jgi:hypothetical protein